MAVAIKIYGRSRHGPWPQSGVWIRQAVTRRGRRHERRGRGLGLYPLSADDRPPDRRPAAPRREDVTVAPMRILLVEDNLEVGQFAATMLQEIGHTVTRVGDAQSAIAVLNDSASGYDLVSTDVVMPGASGVDLAREVRDRWPGLSVVLTSGHSHVLAQDEGHGFPLLKKPYTLDTLMMVLADTPAARSSPAPQA